MEKEFRRTKQHRRRQPRRAGARPPSPEYHIGDRHRRSQRAKQDIMLDHSAGMPPRSLYDYHTPCMQYNKRGPRVTFPHHPLSIPISSMDLAYTEWDLPPFMDCESGAPAPATRHGR